MAQIAKVLFAKVGPEFRGHPARAIERLNALDREDPELAAAVAVLAAADGIVRLG